MGKQLTHMVFCQPFVVIQTCQNTVINLLNLKFSMFLYSHQHVINFCLLFVVLSPLVVFVLFHHLIHKNA